MTTDTTITIAGLRAQIDSLSDACRALGADCVESIAQANNARASLAAMLAERDALAAQLAEVRAELSRRATDGDGRVSAICRALGIDESGDDHPVDAIEALRADLASERSHLAACQARIAGLEQAANERSAEVARLTAQLEEARKAGWETVKAENQRAIDAEAEVARLTNERSEWIHAAVSIGEHVDHLGSVAIGAGEINQREWINYAHSLAGRVKARIGALTARVAELEARPALTEERLASAVFLSRGVQMNIAAEVAKSILDALGPVTLPPAQDRAEELCRAYHMDAAGRVQRPDGCRPGEWDACVAAMSRALASLGAPPTSPPAVANRLATEAAALLRKIARIGALAQGGEQSPNAAECIDVARRLEQEQITRPTSPPAARPVFAGVSVDELVSSYMDDKCRDHKAGSAEMCCIASGLRAVLARLEVSLVAPVDPEQMARDFAAGVPVRAPLTARGIPVTPEVGK